MLETLIKKRDIGKSLITHDMDLALRPRDWR